MRALVVALCVALAGCASAPRATATWTPSDAASSLTTSGPLQARTTSSMSGDGSTLNTLYLTNGDNRRMVFIEANALPHDLAVQQAGGALASIMGFFGDEQPTLYRFNRLPADTSIFLCGPEGPALIGVYANPTGDISLVALKTEFQTETTGGRVDIAPYSPDHVCARARFRRS